MTKLLEADIKSLTITELSKRGFLDSSSLLMNELTVGNFDRRVDLAFTNKDRLIAIEIKSEADSLQRLEGQIETYAQYFDKVIVVVAPKFVSKLKCSTPSWLGIWEISNDGLRVHRKGRYRNKVSKSNLIDFLDVVDLKKLSNKFKIKCGNTRYSLEENISNLPQRELRRAVLASLERKFRDVTERFFDGFSKDQKNGQDLKLLSRFIAQKELALEKRKSNRYFWANLDSYLESLREYADEKPFDANQPSRHLCPEHHLYYRSKAEYEDVC